MPNINVPESGHASPRPRRGYQWLPFTDRQYLVEVQRAFNIINARIKGYAPCNAVFQALPRGRSFADLWNDPNVWVSYDPDGRPTKFGGTKGNEITLSQYACRMGHWTIVATLVHELAHVGGAGGRNRDAESTLKACLMQAHFNPYVIGRIESAARFNGGILV
jgi:hypothetical protein